MSSAKESTRSKIEEKDTDYSFIHVRIRKDLKNELYKYAEENKSSLTAVVNKIVEDYVFKKEEVIEEEEESEEDELLNLVVSSLLNLEQRMDFRLNMLQDMFNSLARTLIDSQKLQTTRSKKIAQLKGEEEKDDDTSDILDIDFEKTIYERVKKYIADQGRVMDLDLVTKHIELDPTLKNYLNNQLDNMPGWKEALITDAIEEAAFEIGFTLVSEEEED
ncbi:MAG: hypothetical protein INQ03_16795 [Candidatus Heimdallarchaeota archaeon]|nr:hypothetical protein [Candidatus Heimdallarchaeota archaeon]